MNKLVAQGSLFFLLKVFPHRRIFHNVTSPRQCKNWSIMQVSISSITIPLCTHGDLHQKFAPALGLWHPSFCPVGGHLLGQLPRGGHLSINDFCHFWNFHYNGKNWRLTGLWGLFVALKVYTFLKQIIQTWTEPKLKK